MTWTQTDGLTETETLAGKEIEPEENREVRERDTLQNVFPKGQACCMHVEIR